MASRQSKYGYIRYLACSGILPEMTDSPTSPTISNGSSVTNRSPALCTSPPPAVGLSTASIPTSTTADVRPTPKSWLKSEKTDDDRENGGEAVGEEGGDFRELCPMKDVAELTPNNAHGEISETLTKVAPPQVPEIIDLAPEKSAPQKSRETTPATTPPTVPERPRREIRKPARYANRVYPTRGVRANTPTGSHLGDWSSRDHYQSLSLRSQEYGRMSTSSEQSRERGGWTNEEFSPSSLWSQQIESWKWPDGNLRVVLEWGDVGARNEPQIGTMILSC